MNSESLLDSAYSTIRSKILSLEYEAGTLLSIYKLAEELGMSRTPITHAIKRLELEGLIVSFKNRGIMVREIPAKECIDKVEMMHCYRIYAINLVRQSEDHAFQLSVLEKDFKNILQEKENNNYLKYLESTLDFMETFISATNNVSMVQSFNSMRDIIILSSYTSYALNPHLKYYSGASFYRDLYHYVIKENYEEATDILNKHYEKIRERILISGVVKI